MLNLIIFIIILLAIVTIIIKDKTEDVNNTSEVSHITPTIKEDFTTDEQNQINKSINDIYKADIEAIRNLSNYASYLMGTNNSITVPGTIKSTSKLCINDKCLEQADVEKLLNYTQNNKLNREVGIGDWWTIGDAADQWSGLEIKRRDRQSTDVGYYRFDHGGSFNYKLGINGQIVDNNDILFDLQNTQRGVINSRIWGSADLQNIKFKSPFRVLIPTIYLAVDYIKLCDNENIQGLQLWSKNESKTGFTAHTWVPDYWTKACKDVRIKWLAVAVTSPDNSDNGQV